VTLGINYKTANPAVSFLPALKGWRFTGWWTEREGGVRIIGDWGLFDNDVSGGGGVSYTAANGSWCYPDDATLYAQWEPQVVSVSLQTTMFPATDPDATTVLYQKYDIGWYLDLACTQPAFQVVVPVWRGHDFKGYFTEPGGAGSEFISVGGLVSASLNAYTVSSSLFASWDATPYLVEVALRLDGGSWAGREVALYQSGVLRYALGEKGGAPGAYEYYVDSAGDASHGVVGGSYDVYVDGAPTGAAVTVDGADETGTSLDFYTATVTTTLDGTSTAMGAVTLRRGNAVLAVPWEDVAGPYRAPVLLATGPGADNAWKVYLDGVDTGLALDMADPGARAASVPYYDATFEIVYDGSWPDAEVTLRQDGAVRHRLPWDSDSGPDGDGDTTALYHQVLRGDTGGDPAADTYQVFVNGQDTGESLVLTAATSGDWAASAEYYLASAAVTRDGADWQGIGVELWQGGARAYTLSYDAPAHAYRSLYVRKYAGDTPYELHVSGSISAVQTGIQVTEAGSPGSAASVAYFSVSYVDRLDAYLTQVVRGGQLASEPAAPYHPGYTFTGWRTGSATGPSYDFGTAVTGTLTLFAGFDAPTVTIGGYVKCNADGTVNGSGAYYRMANLSVRGFPLTDSPVTSATLTMTNGEISLYPASAVTDAGYALHNNLDTAGTGSVSITFGGGASVADAQRFLREHVIVKVKNTAAEHRLRMSVYGMTN
jgi:uncharacterized repeat protein (TIGR02543 family)